MRAMQLRATDGPGSLELRDVETPTPGPGEVLIDVAYAGVTFPELLQSRGQYQMQPPVAYAGSIVGSAAGILQLPESVSLTAGAGMPMNLLTVDFALRVLGRLEPGQTVLVHGAAGGLGSALVQVARAYGGEVVGVVST